MSHRRADGVPRSRRSSRPPGWRWPILAALITMAALVVLIASGAVSPML